MICILVILYNLSTQQKSEEMADVETIYSIARKTWGVSSPAGGRNQRSALSIAIGIAAQSDSSRKQPSYPGASSIEIRHESTGLLLVTIIDWGDRSHGGALGGRSRR